MSARQYSQLFTNKGIPLTGREWRRTAMREIKKLARVEQNRKKGIPK